MCQTPGTVIRHVTALGLAIVAVAAAIDHGRRAYRWNEELAIASPLALVAPVLDDPHTPRLARKVVLVVIDGLGADEAHLPFLDELRARGVSTIARVPYPTVSRPNYVTLLTGVPPRDSGVRANRVTVPVAVDTVMDRVRAAGLRVATASDYGSMASLFLRGARTLDAGPPTPRTATTWPFDDARRVQSLEELAPIVTELAASDAALVAVLVLDVDRAGHADGVGEHYRAEAAAVDRMLRGALAAVDYSRDAVIVTADHGHVAPGGHGGVEREVSHVPLVLAGAGIAPGAAAHDARSIDVAPTVAALLGVPAPGHAEGRALVEVLALSSDDAARRAAADDARARAMIAAAPAGGGVDRLRLAVAALGLALAVALGLALRRRGAVALPGPRVLAGAAAFAVMPIATLIVTRGRLSPSYIPSLDRVEHLGTIAVIAAVAIQVAASWIAIRRAPDRIAAANGVALVGLAIALGTLALVRAWLSPPFIEVPSPAWMVGVPALEIAAAATAAAIVPMLALAQRSARAPHPSRSDDR